MHTTTKYAMNHDRILGLSSTSDEEFGGGHEVPSTNFIIFGILTFWVYTSWQYLSLLERHLQQRMNYFTSQIKLSTLNLSGQAIYQSILKKGFSHHHRVRYLVSFSYMLSGLLHTIRIVDLALLDNPPSYLSFIMLIVASIIFLLNTLFFIYWIGKKLREHEYHELLMLKLIQDPSQFQLRSPSTEFVKRWEHMNNSIAIFLIFCIPAILSLVTSRYMIISYSNSSIYMMYFATPCILIALFHLWGTRLIISLYNFHLRFEIEQIASNHLVKYHSGAISDKEVVVPTPANLKENPNIQIQLLKERLADLAEDLQLLEDLLGLDVSSSLNKIRFITEKVLYTMCKDEEVSWGQAEPTLERMIGPLVAGGYIPKNVAIHVRTIQANSSAGSHYQEFELTTSHVTIAQSALIEFLNWYYTRLPKSADGLKVYDTPAEPEGTLTQHFKEIVLERLSEPEPEPTSQKDEPDWEFRDLRNNRGWLVEAVQIERQSHYREDIAKRLQSQRWGRQYLRMLEAILELAERIWGPRGSSQAFITCVFFSLFYAYALFWLSLASGWENPFGVAAGLQEVSQLGLVQRWSLFGFAVIYPVAVWPIGRWLGFVDKHYQIQQRRRLGYRARWSWSRRYQITSGSIVAACFVVVCFSAIFIMVRAWTNAEGVLEAPLELIKEIVTLIMLGICLGAGPIFGVAWGGWAAKPWRSLCLGVGVVASAGAFAGAFAEAIAGAGPVVIASALAATIAIVGAASVALAGAFAFAAAFCAAAVAAAAVGTAVAGLINSAAILTIAMASAATGAVAAMSVRAGVKRANLYAAMIGSFAALALAGLLFERDHVNSFAYFAISMLLLPVINGSLDYASWWVSRFLGHDLTHGLAGTRGTAVTLARSLAHITADLLLALFFFVAMAFALGFAFESYDLYVGLEAVDLTSYAAALRDEPLGAGLWIALMLLTTLIPTVIHFGMVIGAILPTTLLTNARCRTLTDALVALGAAPPPRQTQDREVWAVTIRDSAKFAASYRWRMLWGVTLTCGLLAALFGGLGLVYEHVFLTEWAYWGGVRGIEAARWLFG